MSNYSEWSTRDLINELNTFYRENREDREYQQSLTRNQRDYSVINRTNELISEIKDELERRKRR